VCAPFGEDESWDGSGRLAASLLAGVKNQHRRRHCQKSYEQRRESAILANVAKVLIAPFMLNHMAL
jgi:hypothetical protein